MSLRLTNLATIMALVSVMGSAAAQEYDLVINDGRPMRTFCLLLE